MTGMVCACIPAYTSSYLIFKIKLNQGPGNPLQYSCLENPVDGGPWWAAVYGVASSWTWLKRLCMHAILTLARRESCHLQNENLTSFPTWTPFISFSSLIAMARTSKTMLNNRGESGHLCLVSWFYRKCFQFSTIENSVCSGFVVYGRYYVEICSSYAYYLIFESSANCPTFQMHHLCFTDMNHTLG